MRKTKQELLAALRDKTRRIEEILAPQELNTYLSGPSRIIQLQALDAVKASKQCLCSVEQSFTVSEQISISINI